jgi:Phytanoyl-CoA dioxygenase (PhyH)
MVGDSSSSQPGSPPLALTASQWLQLDVYGLVLIDGFLKHEEIGRMKDALYRLKTEPDLDALGVYVNQRNDHLFHVGHVLEYDPLLLECAAHPRLTALAGEVVGGKVLRKPQFAVIGFE